jgi:NAD(P)-dependent dehydrogenase (short-subunit alcohol dehydrogenase family)
MARVAHAVFPCQSPATPMRSGAFVTVTQITGVAHLSVIPVSVAELHRSRPPFAAEGMRLVMTDLKGDVLPVAEDIARRYPSSGAIGVVTEVSDPAACDALISAAVGRHGGVDVLAHATAIPQQKGPTAELTAEEWDRVMAVNAKGAFLLCRSVIPVLPKPGGAIVFTGSFTGEIEVAERAAHSASKGALRLFTQSLALELARDGIRVNGVAPAFVESAMGRQTLEITAASERITVEQAQAKRDATIPLARQASAREVAEAFLYLASPAASYATGTWLDVNGAVPNQLSARESRACSGGFGLPGRRTFGPAAAKVARTRSRH